MAKIIYGPHLQTPTAYSTGASNPLFAGLTINTDLTSVGIPESWTATTLTTALGPTSPTTCYRMFSTVTTTPAANKFLAGGPSGSTKLLIYSGARPAIGSVTNLNNYTSNLLISFSIPAYSTSVSATGLSFNSIIKNSKLDVSVPYEGVVATLGICPTFTAATGAGAATWFWFGNYSSPTNLSGISFVTGSIGLTGSGNDLEMPDVNIESGGLYKSLGFKFYIPAVHELV